VLRTRSHIHLDRSAWRHPRTFFTVAAMAGLLALVGGNVAVAGASDGSSSSQVTRAGSRRSGVHPSRARRAWCPCTRARRPGRSCRRPPCTSCSGARNGPTTEGLVNNAAPMREGVVRVGVAFDGLEESELGSAAVQSKMKIDPSAAGVRSARDRNPNAELNG
jgi:hypothetical protein